MKRLLPTMLIIALLFLNIPLANAASAADDNLDRPILSVISSDEREVVVQLDIPRSEIVERFIDGRPCQDIRLGSEKSWMDHTSRTLPSASLFLATPGKVNVRWEILNQQIETISWLGDLCPSEQPFDLTRMVDDPQFSNLPAPVLTPQPELNEPLISVSQQGYLRFQPFVELTITPLQPAQQAGHANIIRKMIFRVNFDDLSLSTPDDLAPPLIIDADQSMLTSILPK